ILRYPEIAVIILDLSAQHVDAVLGAFQSFGGPDNADIIPHETADFRPCLLDNHFFVTVSNAAFVPWLDGRRRWHIVPMGRNVAGGGIAKDETFQQAVRCQTVGSVQTAFARLSGSIEAGQVGTAIQVDQYPATGIMLCRDNGDRLFGHINAEAKQLVIYVGEMSLNKCRVAVGSVEKDIVKAEPLNLVVDIADDNIARAQVHAFGDHALHELVSAALITAFYSRRQIQRPPFPA